MAFDAALQGHLRLGANLGQMIRPGGKNSVGLQAPALLITPVRLFILSQVKFARGRQRTTYLIDRPAVFRRRVGPIIALPLAPRIETQNTRPPPASSPRRSRTIMHACY